MEKIVLPNEVLLGEVTELLGEGREVVMTPKGNSMLPFIHGCIDSVVLKKAPHYSKGDIVLACFKGIFVMHRIISIDGSSVTLMGDGNIMGCEKGNVDEIFGKVIDIVTPKGRHHKPTKGIVWYWLLPIRKYILKIHRKWNKVFRPEYIS